MEYKLILTICKKGEAISRCFLPYATLLWQMFAFKFLESQ